MKNSDKSTRGDYTKDRQQWLPTDLNEIYHEIQEMQMQAETGSSSE